MSLGDGWHAMFKNAYTPADIWEWDRAWIPLWVIISHPDCFPSQKPPNPICSWVQMPVLLIERDCCKSLLQPQQLPGDTSFNLLLEALLSLKGIIFPPFITCGPSAPPARVLEVVNRSLCLDDPTSPTMSKGSLPWDILQDAGGQRSQEALWALCYYYYGP